MHTDIDMTKRHTPESVTDDQLTFSIPLYQRLFAWGDEQVVGLMYDLWQHFMHYPHKPYFIGMLSCIGNPQTGRLDIIDGQQRFTVAILMGLVLRRYDERWDSFIDDAHRLYFTARESDNDCIHALLKQSLYDSRPDNRMQEAVTVIQRFLDDKTKFSGDEDQQRFAGLVFEKMSFFLSVLPDSYGSTPSSLNEYFEAMNASGKGLEQHDILKVQLLRGENNQDYLTRIWNVVCDMDRPIIRKGEDCSEKQYRDVYLNAIRLCKAGDGSSALSSCILPNDASDMTSIGDIQPLPISVENEFGENMTANYVSIITFPQFLMMVFDIYHNLDGGYSYYRQDILSTYGDKRYLIKDKRDFFNTLLLYRLLFDYYIIHREGTEYSEGYDLMVGTESAHDFFGKALIQFQSMLFVSQTPIYNWLKPMLMALKDKEAPTSSELLGILKSLDSRIASHTPPNTITNLSYKNRVDRYWFWKLEYLLWEKHESENGRNDKTFSGCSDMDHNAISCYVFRRDRSIEHLHPQNPPPEGESQDWDEDRRDHKDEIRDGFGNLAMISSSFNSAQRNDSISTKMGRIDDQVREKRLQSIKLLLMVRSVKSNPAGWSVKAAQTHGEKMLEFLKKEIGDAN